MIVFIAEDDPPSLLFLSDWLKAEGYSVVTASHGEEVVRLIEETPPDLVLLDIMLPGMSGTELLPAIKQRHPKVPVVMVTALWDAPERKRAFELGASDYVTKPLDLDYLRFVVHSALKGGASKERSP
ncbi:MAG: response regulator transcription factor [Candidatus Methylomirabilia bacterium]